MNTDLTRNISKVIYLFIYLFRLLSVYLKNVDVYRAKEEGMYMVFYSGGLERDTFERD